MFADANLRLTKNQKTGQTKLPEIIPLTVYRFQAKPRNQAVFFFSGNRQGKTTTALLHPSVLFQTALQLLTKLHLPHDLRQTHCFRNGLAGQLPLTTQRISISQGG